MLPSLSRWQMCFFWKAFAITFVLFSVALISNIFKISWSIYFLVQGSFICKAKVLGILANKWCPFSRWIFLLQGITLKHWVMQKLPLAYNHLSWKLLLEVRCDRQENLTVANYAVYTWVRTVWFAISSLMPCLHELLRTIHVANYSAITQPCIVYHLYGVIPRTYEEW